MIEMRKPARRTAPSVEFSSNGIEALGVITCECTGEWAEGIKCWTEVGKPCGNQYSLARTRDGKFYFILEATN